MLRETSPISYYLPNKYAFNRAQLVMIAAAWDIVDEVYNCTGFATRMHDFTQPIVNNPRAFVVNGRAILAGLKLIKKELKKIKSNVHHSRFSSQIKQSCKQIKREICGAGFVDTDLDSLASLEVMYEEGHIHCSHHNFVKDGKWNLLNEHQ